MAFSAGRAPKVGGYNKGGGDIYGTHDQTGYQYDFGAQQQERGKFEKQRLADAASGRTSVAQQQLRSGLGQMQQGLASQAGAGGANPLAQRAAIMGGAQAQQQMVGQSAALRAQEMAAAQDAYSRAQDAFSQGHLAYDQMGLQGSIAEEQMYRDYRRHQTEQEQAARDFGMQIVGTAASAVAGGMSDERAKMGPAMASGSQQDATIRALGGYGSGPDMGYGQRNEAINRMLQQQPAQQQQQDDGGNMAAIAGAIAGAMSDRRSKTGPGVKDSEEEDPGPSLAVSDRRAKGGYTMSDERAKTAAFDAGRMSAQDMVRRLSAELDRERLSTEQQLLQPSPRALDDTTRGLDTYRYQYRPEVVRQGQPAGNQAGIMAQDLERTPLGEGLVRTGPDGYKRVDTDRGALLSLGLVGRLGERQDATEREVQRLVRLLDEEQQSHLQRLDKAGGGRR